MSINAPKCGFDVNDIEIKYIGRKVSEKLHEDLMTPEEVLCAEDNRNLFIIRNHHIDENHPDFVYNSYEIEQMSKNNILGILEDIE